MIKTIYYEDNAVFILDQNKLPAEIFYQRCDSPEQLAHAIKALKVRGAPLIGVTAAFAMALAVKNYRNEEEKLPEYFSFVEELLASTRPTAVNLFWALKRIRKVFETNKHLSCEEIADYLLNEAILMYDEDINVNMAIGENGQKLFLSPSRIMTICNAGALATCGYGTALGVIRSVYARNNVKMVWACETRPVLQGARLTVWELMQDKIPVTLITDNMAAHVMKKGKVDAVIAGADRIAANGDSANKIGTYALAVLAKHHGIPFYIAAPFSTVDMSISCGEEIPIEERNKEEVRQLYGTFTTVPEVEVFNPAFDVTPAEYISGIITEKGVLRKSFTEELRKFAI